MLKDKSMKVVGIGKTIYTVYISTLFIYERIRTIDRRERRGGMAGISLDEFQTSERRKGRK